MPRSFVRTTIAPGITREGDQLIAVVRVGSSRDGSQVRLKKKFPLGTAPATMIAWQFGAKRDALLERPATPERGTLAADIAAYLAALPAGRYRKDSVAIFAQWIASPLGTRARAAITRVDLLGQVGAWRDAGVAPNTCNKRLSRLRKLYDALDGPDAANPTHGIKFLREPRGARRDIPVPIVRLILESLPDQGRGERGKARPTTSATKLRLGVMAWTGLPPADIARVTRRDLDFDGARIYVGERLKGAGREGEWIPLLPDGVDAWRAFVDAGLLGKAWSNSSVGKSWRRAIARANKRAAAIEKQTGDASWVAGLAALPPRCKPYDLRHAFGSEVYRITGDLLAVSRLLRHANLETTKRYTKGAASERATAAIALAAKAYAAAPVPPPPAPPLRIVARSS